MERFSSQLYEKYINLKKRKFSEIEENNRKRVSDTLQYQLANEQLIEDFKNENDNLRVKILSMQEQYKESKKLLLQERQKTVLTTKALSNEVASLKETLAHKNDSFESASLGSPCRKSSIRLEDSNECLPIKNSVDTPSGQNPVQSENAAIILHEIDNENRLVLHDEPMSLQPDCCRRTKTNYGVLSIVNFKYIFLIFYIFCIFGLLYNISGIGTNGSCIPCAFHTLVELLVGMKISVKCQTEGLCFSVIHQMSGYNFTLSWVRDEGREEKLFYRVSSLGTIENIAPEWMKDDMVFSLAMCPVFFDRLSRVVGHQC